MSQNLNSVTLLKIPKDLAAAEHQAVAAHIQASDIDGISIGYLGGAWGPEWDQDTNYDLSFLELYAGISGIEIHLPAVTDLSPLSTIAPNLRFVNLGEFKSAKVSLASLAGCSKVELLSLNRVKKDFEVVSELGSITDLYLTGYGPKQIASISRLSSIKNLYLGFGTMADLFEIAGMTSLLNLELMWIKKLHDLEAIKQLAALETLKLANLKQVIKLPDLSGLGNFRSLGIDTLNGLESLDGIRRCGLEELAVYNSKIPPEAFAGLGDDLTQLKRIVIGLGSKGNTDRAKQNFSVQQLSANLGEFDSNGSRVWKINFCAWPIKSV